MKNKEEQLLLKKHEKLWELISTYSPIGVDGAKRRAFNELGYKSVWKDCFYCELYRDKREECLNCPFTKKKYTSEISLNCLAGDSPYMALRITRKVISQTNWEKLCLQIAYMHKNEVVMQTNDLLRRMDAIEKKVALKSAKWRVVNSQGYTLNDMREILSDGIGVVLGEDNIPVLFKDLSYDRIQKYRVALFPEETGY
ncbi:MAG: hypothetical protein DRN81_05795 [Thermoproteota archaeon]|nr:MAG: hypothetical protein DRN81_05795 [Candidatus Korarchaeota archaeon]